MNEEKRALTFNQAKLDGLVVDDYSYQNLPENFIATLEYKVWGKSCNLKLFFCCEDGYKCVISVFHKNYAPKKMPDLNLSNPDIKMGMKLRLKTKVNRNGNTNLLEAHAV